MKSVNCDLYKVLWRSLYDKAIILTVKRMASHLLDQPSKGVYTVCSLKDIQGNSHADALADEAAASARVPLNVSAPYLYYVSLTKKIQLRLTTVLLSLPGRPKPPKREVEHRLTLDTLFASTSHVLFEVDSRVSCARCHCGMHKSNPSLKHWLSCQCSGIGNSSDRPVPLKYEKVHVGNNTSHTSHILFVYRGLAYCNRCGVRSGRLGLRKLAKPCSPPSEYGVQSLKALRQGLKPPNFVHWPCDQQG